MRANKCEHREANSHFCNYRFVSDSVVTQSGFFLVSSRQPQLLSDGQLDALPPPHPLSGSLLAGYMYSARCTAVARALKKWPIHLCNAGRRRDGVQNTRERESKAGGEKNGPLFTLSSHQSWSRQGVAPSFFHLTAECNQRNHQAGQ